MEGPFALVSTLWLSLIRIFNLFVDTQISRILYYHQQKLNLLLQYLKVWPNFVWNISFSKKFSDSSAWLGKYVGAVDQTNVLPWGNRSWIPVQHRVGLGEPSAHSDGILTPGSGHWAEDFPWSLKKSRVPYLYCGEWPDCPVQSSGPKSLFKQTL